MKNQIKKTFAMTMAIGMSLLVANVYAQTFYVQETDEGYHLPVTNALEEANQFERKKEESTYTVVCVVTDASGWGKSAAGYIEILDTKTSEVLLKSKSEKGMRSAFHGMKNPRTLLFSRIAKKQLPYMLEELKLIKLPTINTEAVVTSEIKTKEERLTELKVYYEKQLITKKEYEEQKRKILNE